MADSLLDQSAPHQDRCGYTTSAPDMNFSIPMSLDFVFARKSITGPEVVTLHEAWP